MKILIVDDCRDDFEITGPKLQDLDKSLELEYAESGAEALRRLEEGGIDCILSDYQMPALNGLQLLRKLKEKGDETPFIFITGQGNEQIAAEALRIGADDYFTKDAGIAHFQRLVNSIMRVVNARKASLESRAAQKALGESEERLRSQFKGLSVPTYTWQRIGDDFVLVDFNDAAMSITRGNVARFVGMTAGEMYKDIPEIAEELERCLREKKPIEREMVYRYTYGERKYLAVKYAYAPPDLVLVHTEDISERKRAEELNRIQMDLAMKLSATSNLDEALKTCIEAAMKASGLDCGGVYLVGRYRGDLRLAQVSGLSDEFIRAVSHFEADSKRTQLVKSGKPIHVSYLEMNVHMDSAERREGLKHISIIPILYEEEVIACLNAASHTLDSIPVESQDALEAIGAQLGNAITRIMAVEALQESEEMYRQAVENSPNPIFSVDREGNIQIWNPACEALFKFGKEVIGKHYRVFMKDAKGRREFEKMLRDVLQGSSHSGVVLNLWDAEGTVHNMVSRFYPLYGEGGEVWRAMIASTDVTEQLRTTLALEESERRFRRFFENAPIYCYMIDLGGKIIEANRRTLEVLGYEREELVGKKLIETVYAPSSREKAKGLFEEWKSTGSIRDEEIEVITKSGEKRIVLLSVEGVKDAAGRLLHSIAVQRDITERKRTEERLIESEEKFRELFHNIKDAIYLWEMNEDGTLGRCEEVNEVACQWSGYTREEILAQTPVDINEPEFVDQLPGLLEKLKKSKHVMFRNILITKSGKRIPVEVHDHLFNLKGREMILSVTRNIQDRVDLERDLRFKEYTLEHVADAAFWIGPDAKFIEVNEAACRHLGYSREELLSMTVHDIDSQYSVENWTESWQRLKEEKTAARESNHRTKDGRIIPVEIVADYLEFEGMEYNCAFARDISERRRSEKIRDTVQRIAEALITARDLDDLFKSIHGFLGELFPIENFYIALFDRDTEMLSFPYFVDEYEDTPTPYKLGSGLTEYVLRTGKSLLATPAVVKRLEEEGEVELIGPPSLDWLGVPLHTHDKTIGVLVVQTYSEGVRYGEEEKRMLEFVSTQVAMAIERKKAEDELKRSRDQLFLANKELESFSYSVSHDLRAPLRNIMGFGKALLDRHDEKLDDDAKHYLERIFSNTQRMTNLIDHLLQLSRISRSDLNRCGIDLSVMAMEIIGDLQNENAERSVDFSIQKDVLAVADETLMWNVMENLLRNAWKFTSKRDEALIEFGAWFQEGRTVYFVRDNGVGFDQAQAERLFSPFSRLHTEEEFEGTGIGLATVQRIIHRHGGGIWAEGMENEGATFYFTLS